MMRTFIFILSTTVFGFNGINGFAQEKIEIRKDRMVTVDQALRMIAKQSDFILIYPEDLFEDSPKVELKKGVIGLQELLDEVLSESPVDFKLTDKKVITIFKRDNSSGKIEPLQQELEVSGTVTDENGQPLPGASILVKGTTIGTQTDFDGNFTIKVKSENAILVISYLGFLSQEISLNGQSTLNVALVEDAANLDEIVVIGYGTAKKSDLTGAVTRLDATKFEKQAATSVLEILNGTIAGFNSNQSPSAQGGGTLEIRGANSLTASTEPLIVLDGVIYNGSISDINPNDIASLDVLKDASSAAVYGSRAASGVLIINTKKGSGKVKINFTTETGISTISKHIRPFGPEGYLDFRRDFFNVADRDAPEAFYQNPNDLPSSVTLDQWRNYSNNPNSDDTLEWLNRLNFFDEEIENFLNGNTVDWYNEVTQVGIRHSSDVSASGKNENTSFFVSFGYTDNEGVIVGDEFKAYRARLNLETQVTDWITLGVNTQFSSRDFSSVQAQFDLSNSSSASAFRASPYSTNRNADGSFTLVPHGYVGSTNPLGDHYDKRQEDIRNSLFGVLYANVKLPLGFNYRLSYQNRFDFDREYEFWPSTTARGGVNNSSGGLGFGSRNDFHQHEWMVDNILSWNKEFGNHAFDATFLWNVEELSNRRSIQTGSNFSPNENLGFNGLQFSEFQSITNNDLTRRADALMARLNYRFKDRYLLTASVRRDGFSAFGQQNPRATFPAAALGWVISKEPFFPQGDLINNLKFRLSWGENGNRSVGTYTALARLVQNLYLTEDGTAQGIDFASLANPNLRWEQTASLNLGIDFGLLKNRINGSIELYKSNTTDLLVSRELPSITGFESITTNIGEVENKGVEVTLNTFNINKPNFTWNTGVIFSLNRNEIIELFGDTETVTINGQEVTRPLADTQNGWFPGEAIDRIWDYNIEGVWQLGEEAEAAEFGQLPGDFKSSDVNGDNLYTQLEDKQFIGYTEPRWRLGLRNDFTFLKNFSLSTFLRGEFGHKGQMPELRQSRTAIYDRVNTHDLPYWTADNPTNSYGSLQQTNGVYESGFNVYRDRSYLRIQDVTFAYNFPDQVLEKLKLDNLSVYTSVRNLYTFTDWEGLDPETGAGTGAGNVPMPRIFTFGLNLSL